MLPNRASICDFVCSRCWLQRACHAPSDRRFLVVEGQKHIRSDTLGNHVLENARVIDFVKHLLKIGPPDLDSDAPAESNFAAQNAQHPVIYKVLVYCVVARVLLFWIASVKLLFGFLISGENNKFDCEPCPNFLTWRRRWIGQIR